PADLLQLQTHGRRVRCAARPCAAAGHGHGPSGTRRGAVFLQQLPPLQAGPGPGGEVRGRGYLRPDPGQGLPAQPADAPQLAEYPPAVTARPRPCRSTRPGCEGRSAGVLHPGSPRTSWCSSLPGVPMRVELARTVAPPGNVGHPLDELAGPHIVGASAPGAKGGVQALHPGSPRTSWCSSLPGVAMRAAFPETVAPSGIVAW